MVNACELFVAKSINSQNLLSAMGLCLQIIKPLLVIMGNHILMVYEKTSGQRRFIGHFCYLVECLLPDKSTKVKRIDLLFDTFRVHGVANYNTAGGVSCE